MTTAKPAVTRIGAGVYRVEIDGRAARVYVAGPPGRRWAFWNGRVFRESLRAETPLQRPARPQGSESLRAPMPATVLKVLVKPGVLVKKGETVVILEAMKMELPLRATIEAVVTAIRCHEGELVQPDAVLVELGSA